VLWHATRLVLSVGVAYGSPVRQAMALMEETALKNRTVLDDLAPNVIFQSFGDNALGLVLRCFVDSADRLFIVASELNEAINDKFQAAGITIAFPQRDVHLDTSGPLRVRLEGGGHPDQPEWARGGRAGCTPSARMRIAAQTTVGATDGTPRQPAVASICSARCADRKRESGRSGAKKAGSL
jgi:hypothetical protein